jgi:hypothetical protein
MDDLAQAGRLPGIFPADLVAGLTFNDCESMAAAARGWDHHPKLLPGSRWTGASIGSARRRRTRCAPQPAVGRVETRPAGDEGSLQGGMRDLPRDG